MQFDSERGDTFIIIFFTTDCITTGRPSKTRPEDIGRKFMHPFGFDVQPISIIEVNTDIHGFGDNIEDDEAQDDKKLEYLLANRDDSLFFLPFKSKVHKNKLQCLETSAVNFILDFCLRCALQIYSM